MLANWHLDTLEVDQSDPFATDVREEGVKVDLTDPEFLQGRLVEMLLAEGELERQGVTCALKERPDSCCSACPLRGSLKAHRIRELCKLGQEQERTLMSAVARELDA